MRVTKIVRALQCALNVLLVVVSAATAIAAAVARWTDLLDFDGEPIIGSQREISSILNDTMFQELMVAVFIPSVIVLFIAMVGIAGSYVVTGKGRSKAKLQMSSIFRIIYAVLLAVTLLIEGIIACLLTWFFVGHNVGSFAGNECPYPEFSQDQAIDMLKCPIDYAIKEYILDYPPAWSTLQDTWYGQVHCTCWRHSMFILISSCSRSSQVHVRLLLRIQRLLQRQRREQPMADHRSFLQPASATKCHHGDIRRVYWQQQPRPSNSVNSTVEANDL